MKVESFDYIRAQSVDAVLDALSQNGERAAVMGGGTELVVRMKQQVTSPEVLIDLRHVTELNGIVQEDGCLIIGALTSLRAIEDSGIIQAEFPALAEAVHSVASMQVRNLATIGGNLCQENRCIYYNQSKLWKTAKGKCFKSGGETCFVMNKPGVCYATYRGDAAVALLVLDAEIEIGGPTGRRWQPLAELYSGDGKAPLNLSLDEFVTRIRMPLMPARQNIYLKLSHRKVVDFPLVGLGLAVSPETGVRVAVGALSPRPIRVPEAEALLTASGQDVDDAVLAKVAEMMVKAANPVVNNMVHGTPGYRRRMVGVLLRRAWQSLHAEPATPHSNRVRRETS